MTNDEILQAAKEAGYGTAFYSIDGEPAHEEIWGGPMETQKVRSLIKIIEKRTIERCAVVAAIGPTEEDWTDDSDYDVGMMMGHRNAAAAIRKLGEQE